LKFFKTKVLNVNIHFRGYYLKRIKDGHFHDKDNSFLGLAFFDIIFDII